MNNQRPINALVFGCFTLVTFGLLLSAYRQNLAVKEWATTQQALAPFIEEHQSMLERAARYTATFNATPPAAFSDLKTAYWKGDGLEPGSPVSQLLENGWTRYRVPCKLNKTDAAAFQNFISKAHQQHPPWVLSRIKIESGDEGQISGEAAFDLLLPAGEEWEP